MASRDGVLFDTVDEIKGRQARMKTTRLAAVAALVTAAGLFVIADAMAQFGGGMPGGGRRGARMEKGSGPGANRPAPQENVSDLVEYRLALLQEDLRLAREQEVAWVAYEERTKALAADVARERTRMQSANTLNAVEQVNHAVDIARNRLTAWEEIAAAAKTLYDGLTPQQKSLADQRFPSIVSALAPGGEPGYGTRLEGSPARRGAGPGM